LIPERRVRSGIDFYSKDEVQMQRLLFLILALFVCVAGKAAQAADLVYFNSSACSVCERWDEEVGVLYGKTDEAKRLALRPQSIHDEKPTDLSFLKGVAFTPTFVVVEDGREVGRIVGYISDYFFWGQLEGLIKKADAEKNTQRTACSEGTAGDPSSVC